ncbi:MAG: transcriptional repressor [Candidatus Buchananbacteria bacterium]|nr:transcriptional repressor [Candidatus Buchananbacteria bacterium]
MDKIINRLTANGYKLTKPRLAVYQYLAKRHQPANAKMIYQAIGQKHDLTSIYRSLDLLAELQMIFSDEIKGQRYYYVSNVAHHHIVCRHCGLIECVPCHHDFSRLKKFSQISHQVLLSGLCKKCA